MLRIGQAVFNIKRTTLVLLVALLVSLGTIPAVIFVSPDISRLIPYPLIIAILIGFWYASKWAYTIDNDKQ